MSAPTSVVLERRSQALYAARTHTTKGTLLSDSSVRELAEAFIELHAAHRALEQAHETQDTALDEALRQRTELAKERDALLHAFPEYADPQAKLEREQLWAKNDELTKERNGLRDELAARNKALRAAEAELEETRRQEEAFRHECIATGDAGEEAIKAAKQWKLAAEAERDARLKAEKKRCDRWYCVPQERTDGGPVFDDHGALLVNVVRRHEAPFEHHGSGYTLRDARRIIAKLNAAPADPSLCQPCREGDHTQHSHPLGNICVGCSCEVRP